MLNIALVGHIDHGKSTLIGRLLYDTNSLPEGKIEEIKKTCEALGRKLEFAYICDALEEERKNQMTIETSQTFFRTRKREYVIIDAPGHKEFLKNMITGASQANAAILIVDAKEGIKEQTKRHAYLLKLLGIPKAIVAVNKMDLVNYEQKIFRKIRNNLISYLEKIEVHPINSIPISAYRGDNVVKRSKRMEWWNGPTIIEALDKLEEEKEFFDFRFAVQDEFKSNKGKIYLGNILAGNLKKGEIVKCFPSGKNVEIKKILCFNEEVESVSYPKAIGIMTQAKLKRGNILAKNSSPFVTQKITPSVFCLMKNIKENENYILRCVTQEVECKVKKILERIDVETLEKDENVKELKETEIGKLKLILKKPITVEKFKNLKELGRFVLLKRGRIIAGGIIT